MAGKRDRGKDARRRAQMERLARSSDAGRGDQRRRRARDAAAHAAAAGPSAARWLVDAPDDGAGAQPVDVVAELLSLDPRTRLRGRGDEQLRHLARVVDGLVAVGATTPSGRPLLDVLVADAAVRDALAPTFDLAALLDGGPVSDRTHDRVVRLATALLSRADAHRAGHVDLHELVAPIGVGRHPDADGLEATVRVAVDGLGLPGGPDPAVLATEGGWVGVSPVEAFLAAARGLLVDSSRDTLGAALYGWMQRAATDPGDGWWVALSTLVEVDAAALLQQSAARAGSDHPQVAGGVLAELISLRHST